jgi:hypothetical protein
MIFRFPPRCRRDVRSSGITQRWVVFLHRCFVTSWPLNIG